MRIGIISSPFARDCRRNPQLNQELRELLGTHGSFQVCNSKSSLDKACQKFVAQGIDHVGIVGGDGTLGFVISALGQAYGFGQMPRIIPLMAGTANFLSDNIYLNLKAKECLAESLKLVKEKKPLYIKKIRTIHVEKRLGFLFACGLPTMFLKDCYGKESEIKSYGNIIKQLAFYTIDGFLGGFLFKKFPYVKNGFPIRFNGHEKHAMIFVSTIKKLPLGVELFPNLTLGEAFMEYVGVRIFGMELIRKCLHVLLKRRVFETDGFDQLKLQEAIFETKEAVFSYSLDGDLLESSSQKIMLELGPTLTFCSPIPMESPITS
jgi:hypothetical protein